MSKKKKQREEEFIITSLLKQEFEELTTLQDSIAPQVAIDILRLDPSENYCICGDAHIPAISLFWFKRMLQVCKKQKIKNLIIGGDLFNFDMLSRFEIERPKPKTPTIEAEIEFGDRVIAMLQKQFQKIYWILGNHEDRLLRRMRDSIRFILIGRLFPSFSPQKIIMSPYRFAYLGNIRLTHPDRTRKLLLSWPNEVSNIYSCPVITFHSHKFGIGFSSAGRLIAECGCLVDTDRISYLHQTDNPMPKPVNGFLLWKDYAIIPYSEGIILRDSRP